ncbi:MAG: hypothetical protein IKT44_02965 [Clostridia bacterium]|nr:hypothetical protein [Clostridia bacterium]
MKKCPNCEMVVNADNECPFCYTTLTYESNVSSDKEKYVLNKYFIWYLIKQSWFSVLCLIVVVLRLIHIRNAIDYFLIFPIVFICFSLVFSFLGRKITKIVQWKYSKGYSEFRTNAIKVLTGILAVIFSFVMG